MICTMYTALPPNSPFVLASLACFMRHSVRCPLVFSSVLCLCMCVSACLEFPFLFCFTLYVVVLFLYLVLNIVLYCLPHLLRGGTTPFSFFLSFFSSLSIFFVVLSFVNQCLVVPSTMTWYCSVYSAYCVTM